MKYIILLLISTLSLRMCSDNIGVKFVSATSQSWSAGTPQGGKGIDYNIIIESIDLKPLEFVALYIDGKVLEVFAQELEDEGSAKIKYLIRSENRSTKTYPMASYPIESNAKAILAFKSNGRIHHLEIEKFEELAYKPMP